MAMRRARKRRWPHRFGTIVSGRGVRNLTASLTRELGHSVSPKTVYEWMSGRRPPALSTARALVRLFPGQLRFTDIFQPSDEYRRRRAAAAKPASAA